MTNEGIEARTRSYLGFLLSRACDGLGDHDAAFAHAALANRLLEARFDVEAFDAETEAILRELPADVDPSHASASHGERSVFIVGMPRSGTSLLGRSSTPTPTAAASESGTSPACCFAMNCTGRSHPRCLREATAPDLDALAVVCEDMESRLQPRSPGDQQGPRPRSPWFVSMMLPACRAIVLRRQPLDNLLSIFLNPLTPEGLWPAVWRGGRRRRRFDRLTAH